MSDSAAALRAERGMQRFIDSLAIHDLGQNYTVIKNSHSFLQNTQYNSTKACTVLHSLACATHRHKTRQPCEPKRQQDVVMNVTL